MTRKARLYIMTNRPNGTLYVGVTNDVIQACRSIARAYQTGLQSATISSASCTLSVMRTFGRRSNARRR